MSYNIVYRKLKDKNKSCKCSVHSPFFPEYTLSVVGRIMGVKSQRWRLCWLHTGCLFLLQGWPLSSACRPQGWSSAHTAGSGSHDTAQRVNSMWRADLPHHVSHVKDLCLERSPKAYLRSRDSVEFWFCQPVCLLISFSINNARKLFPDN